MNATKQKLIHEVGEFELIRQLTTLFPTVEGVVGPGDDCAIISPGTFCSRSRWQIVTTDTLVEDCHFRYSWTRPYDLGWKSLAVSLSDIAAMGGVPEGLLVSLQLRADLELAWVTALYSGIRDLATKYRVALLGGNCVSSTEIAITTTVLGSCDKAPVRRCGAGDGEDIWVSGTIGESALGFRLLNEGLASKTADHLGYVQRYHKPQPRVELGAELLKRSLASAMIDLSDGLLQDAGHLAEQSNGIVSINLHSVPIPRGVDQLEFTLADALTGGEDYELLFVAPSKVRSAILALMEELQTIDVPVRLTRIGTFRALTGVETPFVEVVNEGNNRLSSTQWLEIFGSGRDRGGFNDFK